MFSLSNRQVAHTLDYFGYIALRCVTRIGPSISSGKVASFIKAMQDSVTLSTLRGRCGGVKWALESEDSGSSPGFVLVWLWQTHSIGDPYLPHL